MMDDWSKTKAQLIAELEELRAKTRTTGTLSYAQDRFKQMVDDFPLMIYETDCEGNFTYANKRAFEEYGYDARDMERGVNIAQTVLPEDLERAKANMERIMKGDPPPGQEFAAIRRDGSKFDVRVFSQALFKNGEPIGTRGIIVDLSDIRQAEQALKKSEAYYRTLFENTGTAKFIFDRDYVIQRCNSQFEKLSGFSREEIEGRMKWSDFVDSLELERILNYYAERQDSEKNAPIEHEFSCFAKESVRIQVHVVVGVIPGAEERICSLIDITERKLAEEALRKSEERYELVVRGANDGIWDWDMKNDIVFYSPRYKEILGYSDEEFPNTGESWLNNVYPEDLDIILTANKRCLEGKIDHFQVEYRMRHKDGSLRWIQGKGASVKDENGVIYRLAGTHTDITERKAHEQTLSRLNEELEQRVRERTLEVRNKAKQLEEANKRLTKLDDEKSAIVSAVSHELRTPLTSVRGFAKLAEKNFQRYFLPLADGPELHHKGNRIRDNLITIENEGERLTRLISDFLDINRIESGKANWNDSDIDIRTVVKNSVNTLSGAFASEKDVVLKADYPQTVPLVRADPDKIQQVVINLLDNAYKFTSKGSVSASIVVGADFLTITVTDTGVGIPLEEQPRVFEKFHKTRKGDTVEIKDKGTGLGLALCREIVSHYGGSIWVESTPGKGSSFTFSLPVLED